MKQMFFAVLFSVLVISPAKSAVSNVTTGNQLYEFCTKKNSEVFTTYCVAYIVGVVEGLNYGALGVIVFMNRDTTTKQVNKMTDVVFGVCKVAGANFPQYIDIITGYLKQHPKTRHQPARALIHLALKEAFPCKN